MIERIDDGNYMGEFSIWILANKLNSVIDELNKLSKSLQYDGNTIQKDDKSIQYPFETRVGMLRQWLNEDRITDSSRMVTNEDIMVWLKNDYVTPEPSQQVQNVTQGDSLCNPEREHNFTLEHQGIDPEPLVIKEEDYTLYTKEDIDEAVEAYKKRLVEKLESDKRSYEENLAAFEWRRYLRELIKLVEETE